jgi:hypothetical protein
MWATVIFWLMTLNIGPYYVTMKRPSSVSRKSNNDDSSVMKDESAVTINNKG